MGAAGETQDRMSPRVEDKVCESLQAHLGGEDGEHRVARAHEVAVATEGQVGARQHDAGVHNLHLDIRAHLLLHLQ